MDFQLDQIGHINIQGSDRHTFTNIGEITQPYSLTVYAGGFYDRIVFVLFFFALVNPGYTAVFKNRILVIAKKVETFVQIFIIYVYIYIYYFT